MSDHVGTVNGAIQPLDPAIEHQARLAVAARAVDAAEAYTLLAMLGLIEPAPKPGKRARYGSQGCGTRAGFQRHRDRGQTPCERCREAQRTYMRDYQRTRYTPERRRRQYAAAKARGYYAQEAS